MEELCEALLPEGEYEVMLVSEERIFFFNRRLWRCLWRVVEGDHAGAESTMWLNIPGKSDSVRRGHAVAQAYVVATGRRPPRDLNRRRPSSYLGGCVFRARVRTVRRDMHGIKWPEKASYSKVNHLIETTAGTPPCL
jgi:hypothetical protein